MKWKKFTLTTTTEAVDYLGSMFDDIGIQGMEVEDNIPLTEAETKGMFIDILPELPPDEGVAKVSFYLDDNDDVERILREVQEGIEEYRQFVDMGAGTIEASETEDKDWINNWKQYFKPFTVDNILIKPTWEPIPEEHKDKMLIQIDPGTAFGTGMHETTQLCVRAMKKYTKEGMEILDVGCGSGILGMLGLKFGAAHSVGTDLDPCAITATHENMEVNGISKDQYEVMIGNIIDDKEIQDRVGYEKYDIVAANILAEVLVPLTPVIVDQMKTGSVYITSGIIAEKEETVVNAVKAAGLEVLEVNHQGEWVSVVARKN